MKTSVRWVGNWSDYDVPNLVRELKAAGIVAKSGYSPYVGHHTLLIAAEDLGKARELLPEIDPENGQYIVEECLG